MKKTFIRPLFALLTFAWGLTPPFTGVLWQAAAHDRPEHFDAGEPGDPKKPFRVVKVTMLEDGKKMLFEPAVVEVRLVPMPTLPRIKRAVAAM